MASNRYYLKNLIKYPTKSNAAREVCTGLEKGGLVPDEAEVNAALQTPGH